MMTKTKWIAFGLGTILLSMNFTGVETDESAHTDAPFIPGSTWRVHDMARPQPKIVEPGIGDLGTTPPSDANGTTTGNRPNSTH